MHEVFFFSITDTGCEMAQMIMSMIFRPSVHEKQLRLCRLLTAVSQYSHIQSDSLH